MVDRTVTQTKKDSDGDILALCEPGAAWSPRQKAEAISDIDNNRYRYLSNGRTLIEVVNRNSGKYLRTVANNQSDDNLDNLPDC